MKYSLNLWYYIPILFVAFSSCQKELEKSTNNSSIKKIELTKDSNQNVINIEQNGIIIEFCLLNETGQPSTVFYEGENFKFHLGITNNIDLDTSLYIHTDFLKNKNLFMVFSDFNDTVGKPINLYFWYKCGDNFNELKQGKKWYIDISWNEIQGTDLPFDFNNLLKLFQYRFIGLNQSPLPKGRYYTDFVQKFCLERYGTHPDEDTICTDTLQLKIHFEII